MTLEVKDGKLYADGIEVHPDSVDLAYGVIFKEHAFGSDLVFTKVGDYITGISDGIFEVPLRVKGVIAKCPPDCMGVVRNAAMCDSECLDSDKCVILEEIDESSNGTSGGAGVQQPKAPTLRTDESKVMPDAENIKEVEAECNDCAWEGRLEDMDMDDLDGSLVYLCPKCNSENIYYF